MGKGIGPMQGMMTVRPLGPGKASTRGPRWRYRCVACRVMFDRPEYSDETKCPKCVAALLEENARGYRPKPLPRARLVKHGMTQESFHAMAAKQGGVCAICKRAPQGYRSLVIDHNHDTGKVRGLLCEPCNTGLGFFGDDPRSLLSALSYLRRRGDYSHMTRERALRVKVPEVAE